MDYTLPSILRRMRDMKAKTVAEILVKEFISHYDHSFQSGEEF